MERAGAHELAWRSVADLVPYARNARVHSDEQIAKIAASIARFGFNAPVLIDARGEIIAGHGRVLGAARLGWDKVPTIELPHLSEDEKRAYIIADNRLADAATWDDKLLAAELDDLAGLDFDLIHELGFDDQHLAQLLDGLEPEAASAGKGKRGKRKSGSDDPAAVDPDTAPPPPERPASRKGDLWLLGDHRLLCGDSTSEAAVSRLLDGEPVDMILGDPPYCSGGFQESGRSVGSVGTRGDEMIANDTLSTRGYMALMKAVLGNVPAGIVYLFTDWRMWNSLFDVVESCGFGVRNMIVWDKETPGMGVGWRMQHELVMCGIRVKSPFDPKAAMGNVRRHKRTGNKNHATEKPVGLLREIIRTTAKAETVWIGRAHV